MKKNQKHEQQQEEEKEDIEILKAVAQAWHGQSSSARSSTAAASEFDAHRRFFKGRPTRFKIEAATNLATTTKKNKDDSYYHHQCGPSWDFRQSLWDSYEIISVSKKLETGLVMADPFSALENGSGIVKKRKEGKNSLRNLFNKMSSRRFSEEDLPSD